MFTEKELRAFGNNYAAIYQDGKTLTYNQLLDYSLEINKNLDSRDLVFCFCTNKLESLVGYVSFIMGDTVPVLLDSSISSEKLNDLIQKYSPRYVWAPVDLEIPNIYNNRIAELNDYQLLENGNSHSYEISSELKLLLTTSGSTGSSKFVRISLRNLESNARSIAEYLSIDENERPITVLPMHYSYGLSIINSHLIKGATLLMTDNSIMERAFWEMLHKHGATSFSGVPYTYRMLKSLSILKKDLPSLKTFTQAGGKLSDELIDEFSKFCSENGKNFFVMYGQTEATARMTYLSPKLLPEKLGSVGFAIPGGKIEITNEEGTIVPTGQVGELVYYGDNVSLGYAESKMDLNKPDINRGVLKTGDLALKDEDGCIYIKGRKKRFLKIFGNRINLDEVEQQVKKIAPEAACSGVDDQLIVFITDKSKEAQIKKCLIDKIKLNRTAMSINIIDQIPKNSSGKTLYSSLESLIK